MPRESGHLVESCLDCASGCEALRAQKNPRQGELGERLHPRRAPTRSRCRLFGRSQRAIRLATVRICFRQSGCRERVMTDNGSPYVSRRFRRAVDRHRIGHLRTRPYHPETNGKAERFIQTLLLGWAYKRPYRASRTLAALLQSAPIAPPELSHLFKD